MPACPFSGWYMVTEIGARDFGDANRYNMLEPVALRMGLDTKSLASLWKDVALVEINVAVMYSFQEAGVTITDHHSASESFMKHVENEEMLNYMLKPSYEYQDDPWKHHSFKKNDSGGSARKKASFKGAAKAVIFFVKLFRKALAKRQKAVILYATETGKSERYAKMLGELFSHAFDPKVVCMEEYAHPEMENEQLVLIVTSTFGNGDPPENGEKLARYLYETPASSR
ncbi:hypothetical protein OS493_004184 [Desmophyllum pertusum]|uniref:nitric-oxide synthase (NADPH) n=1 Tax=Desmophyllum pertusum TaxID=174260 RepID=A0A9W9ZU54_9CNID|nr:hypothetical protein OS493_004184 [Desmophyllum pertusum]